MIGLNQTSLKRGFLTGNLQKKHSTNINPVEDASCRLGLYIYSESVMPSWPKEPNLERHRTRKEEISNPEVTFNPDPKLLTGSRLRRIVIRKLSDKELREKLIKLVNPNFTIQ